MGKTITVVKTKKAEDLIVQDQVAATGTTLEAQLDVVDSATKVTVVTGSTAPKTEVASSNVVIAGKAGNAAVKQVVTGINSVVNSDNTITLSGVKVSGSVYGGAFALDAKGKIASRGGIATAVVNGSSTINLDNVSVKNVFGGGAGYGSTTNGNIEINYNGGKVSAIYGGGDRAEVYGNVTINIGATTNGKVSKIYAGGKNSNVYGKATVVFSSNSGLINNFSGTVYGTGQKGSVTGGSELVFENYSGEFKGSIQAFGTITIKGSSNVVMTKSQHKTMKDAEYVFVLDQGHTSPMLTWNKKAAFANITVQIATEDALNVILIQSKYFKKDTDFNTSWITVTNEAGEKLSSLAYELVYTSAYEYQVNAKGKGKWVKVRDEGYVSISYKGTNATFSGEEEERVVLSKADDKVNVTGNLKGGLDTGAGNDRITLQEGAKVAGGIDAGDGDDTLFIQKNVELNGGVDMGKGNDTVYVEEAAKVTSNIALGEGTNSLTVQKDASVTGTVILEDGSNNTITVNGGAISSISGKAASNTIHLNGNITGGGIGYWTELKATTTVTGGYAIRLPDGTTAIIPGDYVQNNNPNKIFITGNLDLRNADSNDTIYINQYAAVNSIYLGKGDDYLEIAAGAYVGVSWVSFGNENAFGIRPDGAGGTIDLGSGNNTLVLKGDINANVTCDIDAKNTIVLAGNITIDSNKFLMGRTGNVLVVSNGVEATFNAATVGAFIDGDKLFKGVYLSQNASLVVGNDKVIQNFVGAVNAAGTIYVLDAAGDGFSNAYYARISDGVENSTLNAAAVVIRRGGKVTKSSITGAVTVQKNASLADVEVRGNVTLEEGASLTGGIVTGTTLVMDGAKVDGAILKGSVTLQKTGEILGATVMGAKGATVNLFGKVSAESSIVDASTVEIYSQNAMLSKIQGEKVTFHVDYVNEALALDVLASLTVNGNVKVGSLVFKGEKYDLEKNAGKIAMRDNTVLTLVNDQYTIVNGSLANDSKSFDAGFSVEIRKALAGDVVFNNNTIYLNIPAVDSLENAEAAIYGDISGSGKFILAKGVTTFFDYSQFVGGIDSFSFAIKAGSLLSFDGVISDDQKAALIEKVEFLENNAVFAIGKQAVIQNWNGAIDMTTLVIGKFKGVLPFTDLFVKAGGKITGYICGTTGANIVELGEGVTVNGMRQYYDFGTIALKDGDDKLVMNKNVIVNGSINMGAGDDTIDMLGGVKVNTAVNQKKAAVILNGGTLNVEGAGNAIEGSLDISGGSNTVVIKKDGELTVKDVETTGADNTTLDISGKLTISNADGKLALDAANSVDVTLRDGADLAGVKDLSLEGDAANKLSVLDGTDPQFSKIRMTGSDTAASGSNTIINKGTISADVEMIAKDRNTIDNFDSFNATETLSMRNAKEVVKEEDFIVTIYDAAANNEIENHGEFSAAKGIEMLGSANSIVNKDGGAFSAGDVFMTGVKIITEDTLHSNTETDYGFASGDNSIVNEDGSMSLGNVTMKGRNNAIDNGQNNSALTTGDITMAAEKNNSIDGAVTASGDITMAASGDNAIKGDVAVGGTLSMMAEKNNTIDGTVTASGDIAMEANTANTITGTVAAQGDLSMSGLVFENPDGSVTIYAAGRNTIEGEDVTADSIAMFGRENSISGKVSAANGIVMAGETTIGADGEITYGNAETGNTIDLSTGGNVSSEFASIRMYGKNNVIKSTDAQVVIDRSANDDANVPFKEIKDVNAGITSADGIEMNGETNSLDFSVSATANGRYIGDEPETAMHDHAEITVGKVSLAVNSDISMNGSVSNTLNLGYTLDGQGEAIIHAGDANISIKGNITMTGAENNLDLAITLTSMYQSVVTAGTLVLSYEGTIRMTNAAGKTGGRNSLKLGVIETNSTREGDTVHDKTYSVLDYTGATVTVKGDIIMGGEGAENTLEIGRNTTVTGSIFMGDYSRDCVSAKNTLILDAGSAASIAAIKLLAQENDVTFNGEGEIRENFSVQGERNKITVGEKVSVVKDIVFTDLYDEDGDGYDNGDKLIENTANTVIVNGIAAGIDSSATASNDKFFVYNTTGDITTGNSTDKDLVKIGKGVLADNDVKVNVSAGTVTMGSADALSDGRNILKVTASEYTDENGDTSYYTASAGAIRMYSKTGNTAKLSGKVSAEGEKFAAATGAVTMVSDATNKLDADYAVINGDVAMTGNSNRFGTRHNPATGSTVNGSIVMTADRGANSANSLRFQGIAAEDGVVPADPEENGYNGTPAVQAEITGSVTMANFNGGNTAVLKDVAVGADITMTAGKLAKETDGITPAEDASNKLMISGSSYVNKVWNPVEKIYEDSDPILNPATVGGSITMQAVNDNLFRTDITTINGAVTMTAVNGENILEGADETYAANVVIGETLNMTAKTANQAIFANSAINNTKGATYAVDMSAGIDNILVFTDSVVNGAVRMETENGSNNAMFDLTSVNGSVEMTARKTGVCNNAGNILLISGLFEKTIENGKETDIPKYKRTVIGNVTMDAADSNYLYLGDGMELENRLGVVTLGTVTMAAGTSNIMVVAAGPEYDYKKNGTDTRIDATAKADSLTMTGAQDKNLLDIQQGTFKVGAIEMSNLDKDSYAGKDSSNVINVNSGAVLIAAAIRMGSANIKPGSTTPNPGAYDDVALYDIVRNADGSETYVYVWKDADPTVIGDANLFTKANIFEVRGKTVAENVEMTGGENTLRISGPAANDPNGHNVSNEYDETIARGTFADVKLSGKINTIDVTTVDESSYNTAFEAASIEMGDIVAKTGNNTFIAKAEQNTIWADNNTTFNVSGNVTMTATADNTVFIGDYTNRNNNTVKSAWITYYGNVNENEDNYFNYEAVVNRIGGNVIAAASGSFTKNDKGEIIGGTNGENTMLFGRNTVVDKNVELTGYTNFISLNAENRETAYKVNSDGVALAEITKVDGSKEEMTQEAYRAYWDGIDAKAEKTPEEEAWLAANGRDTFYQITEMFVTDKGAIVTGDIVFHLPEEYYVAGGAAPAPANTVILGAGALVSGGITSADTYTVDGVIIGAADTIIMENGSEITGAVSLGYGNDTITVNGNATIGSIDFGYSFGTFDPYKSQTENTDYLNVADGMVLTVNGNITYAGTLVVNGTVKFADGFGFVAANDDAKLYYQNVTVDNGTIETPVTLLGNLTLKNRVAVNATVTAFDAMDVEYNNIPAGIANALIIAKDAVVTVEAVINLGLGDNPVSLGENASLTLNAALEARARKYKVVDGENVYVNEDGKTDAELQAEYDTAMQAWETGYTAWLIANPEGSEEEFINQGNPKPTREAFVQDYAMGKISMTQATGSTFTVNAETGITTLKFVGVKTTGTVDEPVIGKYTINGTSRLTVAGAVTVSAADGSERTDVTIDTDMSVQSMTLTANADTLTVSKSLTGNVDMGNGDNTVTVTGSLIGNLTAGNGADTITIASMTGDLNAGNGDNTIVVGTAKSITTGNGRDTITLNGDISGAISTGTGSDTVNVEAAIVAGSLTMGGTGNVLNFNAAGANIRSITGANTINITADTTLNDTTVNANVNVLRTASKVVVNDSALTVKSTANNISEVEVESGSVTSETAALAKVTMKGGSVSSAKITVLEAEADFSLTGTNEIGTINVANGAKVVVTGTISQNSNLVIRYGNTGSALTLGDVTLTGANLTATGLTLTTGNISAANITAREISAVGKSITATAKIDANVTAANVTAREVDGRFTVSDTLTGTTFTAVEAGSTANTIKFIGNTVGFNSGNLTASSYVFGTANGVDAITDSARFNNLDALNVSLAKLDMSTVSNNDSFTATNFQGTINQNSTLRIGGATDWRYQNQTWRSASLGVIATYNNGQRKFTFTLA